jgi:lactam utilization protein B
MDVTLEDAYDMIVYQVGALKAFARLADLPLRFASSHGAFSAWENQSPSR